MKRSLIRLLCLLLALSMVLCGCEMPWKEFVDDFDAEEEDDEEDRRPRPTEQIILPTQEEMPDGQLAQALDRLEYAGIAALLELNANIQVLERQYIDAHPKVYVGDVDGDAHLEMVYGSIMALLDREQGRSYLYEFSQSGYTYYTDHQGKLYRESNVGASSLSTDWNDPGMPGPGWDPPLPDSGIADWCCSDQYFTTFDPNQRGSFSMYTEACYEVYEIGENYRQAEKPYYESISIDLDSGFLTGQEARDYWDSMGMTEVTSTAADFATVSLDGKYADHLMEALDEALRQGYSGYQGYSELDYDGDGILERLYLISDFQNPWLQNIYTGEYWIEPYEGSVLLDADGTQTVLLIADPQGEQILFQASAIQGYHGFGNISTSGGSLIMGSGTFLLGSAQPDEATCSSLNQYLSQLGYRQSYFLLADVAEASGNEILAFCTKDGQQYLVIFIIRNGVPQVLMAEDTGSNAYYLTQSGGKTYLLRYSQSISSWDNGTHYSYAVYRYRDNGEADYLDSRYTYVGKDTANATELSALQSAFQNYLVKVIVIYDPFVITGQQYPGEDHAIYATEQEPPQLQPDEQIGYVTLKDPGSWLHLRQGPGTQYAKVLINAADPDSFIRQANGSVVTILETVETGDAQNPVWVKIRIRYAGQEIIGYSSKTYIRIPGE